MICFCDTNYFNIKFLVVHFGGDTYLESGFNVISEANGYRNTPIDNAKEEHTERSTPNSRKLNTSNAIVVIRNPLEAIYATYATYEATYAKQTDAYHFFGKGSIVFCIKL